MISTPDVDETALDDEDAATLVTRLSRAKAIAVELADDDGAAFDADLDDLIAWQSRMSLGDSGVDRKSVV